MQEKKIMKNVSKAQFTLIELLVVIAIIAILAAILLPALNSARERGIQTDCMSRQKSVGAAINMYRSEYNDCLVSQNAFSGTGSSSKDANWISKLMECKYITSGTGHEKISSFACPSEEARWDKPNVERGYGILTYAIYHAWSKRIYAVNLKMQCIQKFGESKVLLVADSIRNNNDGTAGSDSKSLMSFKSKDYGLPYARHNNTINGLLLDGHVESFAGEEMYDKFKFIRIQYPAGGLYAAVSKIPYYVNQKKEVVTMGSVTEDLKQFL